MRKKEIIALSDLFHTKGIKIAEGANELRKAGRRVHETELQFELKLSRLTSEGNLMVHMASVLNDFIPSIDET